MNDRYRPVSALLAMRTIRLLASRLTSGVDCTRVRIPTRGHSIGDPRRFRRSTIVVTDRCHAAGLRRRRGRIGRRTAVCLRGGDRVGRARVRRRIAVSPYLSRPRSWMSRSPQEHRGSSWRYPSACSGTMTATVTPTTIRTPGCILRRAHGYALHDHDGDPHPSDIPRTRAAPPRRLRLPARQLTRAVKVRVVLHRAMTRPLRRPEPLVTA